jgi:hypothetical protein
MLSAAHICLAYPPALLLPCQPFGSPSRRRRKRPFSLSLIFSHEEVVEEEEVS